MFWKNSRTRLVRVLAVLALCAGAVAATPGYGRGGDFTLNAPGGPLSLSDLRGKVVLIFFGYTSCPDVCPTSLAIIGACFSAMDERELDQVRALFITLDPERDSLDRLEKYTGYFHPNIIGLSDKVAAIDAVTQQYGVKYSKNMLPGSALGYSISHPVSILLLDPQGQIADEIPHNTSPKDLLAMIRNLLNASE